MVFLQINFKKIQYTLMIQIFNIKFNTEETFLYYLDAILF